MKMSTEQFHRDHQELAHRIGKAMPNDGRLEVQPGIFLNRASHPGDLLHAVAEPCLCIISQGSKEVLLGEQRFRYDLAHYLITTMALPVSGQVVEATTKEPYLSLRLNLDTPDVTSILSESGFAALNVGEQNPVGINVSTLSEPLLNAVLRLIRMLDDPLEYQVLAPMAKREIIFRLLVGDQGARLRHLAKFGGKSHRMVRAVNSIRSNFDQPMRIEDLASDVNMSVSSFHAHFKAATAMSPLQFQKKLRLQEARRLMLDENSDAAEAAFKVGYEDAAQFNREYKRQFGLPPKRDIERIREATFA
ncbi:AraC family transcriptional regulator [Bremerella sp. JC817]|uniref:AraC family transcriptional regulator n=1 Tax=Bremerella sp. JC817 TaxID=3231756 RepID=UPI003458CBE8